MLHIPAVIDAIKQAKSTGVSTPKNCDDYQDVLLHTELTVITFANSFAARFMVHNSPNQCSSINPFQDPMPSKHLRKLT